ncbi:hypothetical protein [Vulcanococcus sp.]|uniref:hypothetical protein n=1 Tax=Vulcanococcus sp. TaxID=2856995 RepID=UPI003C089E2D
MFTLCLDNAQTFAFQPRPALKDVVVVRKAVAPGGGLRLTGVFPMTVAEARTFWKQLLKDGAFRC